VGKTALTRFTGARARPNAFIGVDDARRPRRICVASNRSYGDANTRPHRRSLVRRHLARGTRHEPRPRLAPPHHGSRADWGHPVGNRSEQHASSLLHPSREGHPNHEVLLTIDDGLTEPRPLYRPVRSEGFPKRRRGHRWTVPHPGEDVGQNAIKKPGAIGIVGTENRNHGCMVAPRVLNVNRRSARQRAEAGDGKTAPMTCSRWP
jgi:hypothetical protein